MIQTGLTPQQGLSENVNTPIRVFTLKMSWLWHYIVQELCSLIFKESPKKYLYIDFVKLFCTCSILKGSNLLITYHYNGTKEVKPATVLGLVSNWLVLVAYFCSKLVIWCNFYVHFKVWWLWAHENQNIFALWNIHIVLKSAMIWIARISSK